MTARHWYKYGVNPHSSPAHPDQDDLNKAATLTLGLILAEMLRVAGRPLASHEGVATSLTAAGS